MCTGNCKIQNTILRQLFQSYKTFLTAAVTCAKGDVNSFEVENTDVMIYCNAKLQLRYVPVIGGASVWLSRYSDSLLAGRSLDRIPVKARFSAPVQTGTGTHLASYSMGTGTFPGLKRAGPGVDHPPHLALRLKKEKSYTSTPPLGLRGLL